MTAKALAMGLQATGRNLDRASLVQTLGSSSFDPGGFKAQYRPGDHQGARYVDLSMVSQGGWFFH